MILAHLPALEVVVPLIAAPLTLVLRRASIAWALTTAACAISFVVALLLAVEVARGGPISYAIGSWAPPWGIEYRVDALSSFMLVLVSGIATVVAPYALRSVATELRGGQGTLLYTMFCLCVAGLLGMSITGDAFNLFVFMEIASLSSYVLIALGRDRRALLASFQYLILGTIGATFFVIGVGLLFLKTGTLNLADMADRLHGESTDRAVRAALAFIVVGMSLKLALFPLHLWLPNAYTYAPSTVTALLAATATKVSVYVLMRFYFDVFGLHLLTRVLPMQDILMGLSILAIVTASLVAVWQTDLKRLFAYSSVAQIGYITLGIALGTREGLTAAIVHLFNHGITKGALFLLLGLVAYYTGRTPISSVRGLARSMPLTTFGITLAGLSLVGVPGTAGFVSKWTLVLAAFEADQWWLGGIVVATSLIAVAYVWRFVEAAYLSAPAVPSPVPRDRPLSMVVPAWILVGACIWFGFDTSYTVDAARRAATLLLEAAQ
ncbi:MAG: monovalent cation/H+ antiporter subunit D family protein [Betaproteobacteria bacterium]|jgi:multicomponent Na+:H+ antiporter subunit D|nr:monovalent cation/H+ antiporter subunit D family protein [Betaproteobacteria bacterium]